MVGHRRKSERDFPDMARGLLMQHQVIIQQHHSSPAGLRGNTFGRRCTANYMRKFLVRKIVTKNVDIWFRPLVLLQVISLVSCDLRVTSKICCWELTRIQNATRLRLVNIWVVNHFLRCSCRSVHIWYASYCRSKYLDTSQEYCYYQILSEFIDKALADIYHLLVVVATLAYIAICLSKNIPLRALFFSFLWLFVCLFSICIQTTLIINSSHGHSCISLFSEVCVSTMLFVAIDEHNRQQ